MHLVERETEGRGKREFSLHQKILVRIHKQDSLSENSLCLGSGFVSATGASNKPSKSTGRFLNTL